METIPPRLSPLSFDQADRIARMIYGYVQAHLEDPDIHSLASSVGNYDDANPYTQTLFREIVQRTWGLIQVEQDL